MALVNGKGGLKKVQPKHTCWRCQHDLAERSMNALLVKAPGSPDQVWECKNRNACDKRLADLGKLKQIAAWVSYNHNGTEVVEEVKAWETRTPGLVAWKHNDMWELIHASSGHFIDFAIKRDDINGMAEALTDVTDWTQPQNVVATRENMEKTGMAIRQYWRTKGDFGTYTGVR